MCEIKGMLARIPNYESFLKLKNYFVKQIISPCSSPLFLVGSPLGLKEWKEGSSKEKINWGLRRIYHWLHIKTKRLLSVPKNFLNTLLVTIRDLEAVT